MNPRKAHSLGNGQIATANLATVYQREIFFQVDPATLDYMDAQDVRDAMPRGFYLELDPEPFLKFLPSLEAEVFYLLYTCQKNQKDVAKLLGLSQPTVSYRYRRILDKFEYLMILAPIDLRQRVSELSFLTENEQSILYDLFYYTNQEMVGRKYGVHQSSVKWIFVKTKDKLSVLEKQDPDKWFHHLGLILLLNKNLGTRVM